MERYCSTDQSPQRAVAPKEEEELFVMVLHSSIFLGCFAKTLSQIRQQTRDHVQIVVDFNISRK